MDSSPFGLYCHPVWQRWSRHQTLLRKRCPKCLEGPRGQITNLHYSILIHWSNEDQTYVVSLPEFGPYAHIHGDTYEEALKNAQEVLELLVESYQEEGKSLPEPAVYDAPSAAIA